MHRNEWLSHREEIWLGLLRNFWSILIRIDIIFVSICLFFIHIVLVNFFREFFSIFCHFRLLQFKLWATYYFHGNFQFFANSSKLAPVKSRLEMAIQIPRPADKFTSKYLPLRPFSGTESTRCHEASLETFSRQRHGGDFPVSNDLSIRIRPVPDGSFFFEPVFFSVVRVLRNILRYVLNTMLTSSPLSER